MYRVPLQVIDKHHYLGILIDNRLSWTPHINSSAAKQINYWDSYAENFITVHHIQRNMLTNKFFLLSIEYCSSIWDPHQQTLIHKLEMIQHRAARFEQTLEKKL